MTKNEPNNDILIGENQWIKHIDLTGRYDQATSIDDALKALEVFLQYLEAWCVAGCCGKDAFDFTPAGIRTAASNCEIDDLDGKIEAVVQAISDAPTDVILSDRMNDYSDRRVALELWRHISKHAKLGSI